jgi:RNA polymerase sigma factor (sigma-70 family)
MTDEQLLEQFVKQHESAAFEELVRRHGPMVLRVCQRVLYHRQDAEDAFQAAFIILARKAGGISKGESLGSWLYAVAYRIALRAKARAQKSRSSEQPMDARAIADYSQLPGCVDTEVRQVLDEELNLLPEKFRAPLVLCYLEGKTTDETADQLGWSRGTVASRLSRARDRLRDRLSRRGLTVTGAALATVLTQNTATAALSGTLAAATAKTATAAAVAGEAPSGAVYGLADETLKSMFWGRLKEYVLIVATLAALTGVVFVLVKPSANDLVGHYAFPEKTGGTQVLDASGSANHGTLVGDASWAAGRKPGTKALSFDGNTGFVQFDQDLSQWLGGSATVAYWVKTRQVSAFDYSAGHPVVLGVHGPANDSLLWGMIDNTGAIGLAASRITSTEREPKKATAMSLKPTSDDSWHHIAMTRDAATGQIQLFVDGVRQSSDTGEKGVMSTPLNKLGKLDFIGSKWDELFAGPGGKTTMFFRGLLEDIRLYQRVLTAAEIIELYQATK